MIYRKMLEKVTGIKSQQNINHDEKDLFFTKFGGITFATTAMAQTGREIAQKVKDRPDGDTRQSELVMKPRLLRRVVRVAQLISYSIDVGKGKKDRNT